MGSRGILDLGSQCVLRLTSEPPTYSHFSQSSRSFSFSPANAFSFWRADAHSFCPANALSFWSAFAFSFWPGNAFSFWRADAHSFRRAKSFPCWLGRALSYRVTKRFPLCRPFLPVTIGKNTLLFSDGLKYCVNTQSYFFLPNVYFCVGIRHCDTALYSGLSHDFPACPLHYSTIL